MIRPNEVKEVSFEYILYWFKVATRHGTARSGTARPEIGHAFAKLITFLPLHRLSRNFAYRLIICMFFFSNFKNAKNIFLKFLQRCPNKYLGRNFQKLLQIMYRTRPGGKCSPGPGQGSQNCLKPERSGGIGRNILQVGAGIWAGMIENTGIGAGAGAGVSNFSGS